MTSRGSRRFSPRPPNRTLYSASNTFSDSTLFPTASNKRDHAHSFPAIARTKARTGLRGQPLSLFETQPESGIALEGCLIMKILLKTRGRKKWFWADSKPGMGKIAQIPAGQKTSPGKAGTYEQLSRRERHESLGGI